MRAYLIDQGIKPERLTAKGYGEDRLLVSPEKTEEDYKLNRRVEFNIQKTAK
mgnify:CR=1 FL=1